MTAEMIAAAIWLDSAPSVSNAVRQPLAGTVPAGSSGNWGPTASSAWAGWCRLSHCDMLQAVTCLAWPTPHPNCHPPAWQEGASLYSSYLCSKDLHAAERLQSYAGSSCPTQLLPVVASAASCCPHFARPGASVHPRTYATGTVMPGISLCRTSPTGLVWPITSAQQAHMTVMPTTRTNLASCLPLTLLQTYADKDVGLPQPTLMFLPA